MIANNLSRNVGGFFVICRVLSKIVSHWQSPEILPPHTGSCFQSMDALHAHQALASPVRCRALMTTWDLCTSNTKSQLLAIPLLHTPLAKMGTKADLRPGRALWLGHAEQPFPNQREAESQSGRETEITHSTIYCHKTTSSTNGATVIIGEKKHSLLTCESDLQRGSLPSTRALSSREHRARWLGAAARRTACRSEGWLVERAVLSPPLA